MTTNRARRKYIFEVLGQEGIDIAISTFGWRQTWATLKESQERDLYRFAQQQEARQEAREKGSIL